MTPGTIQIREMALSDFRSWFARMLQQALAAGGILGISLLAGCGRENGGAIQQSENSNPAVTNFPTESGNAITNAAPTLAPTQPLQASLDRVQVSLKEGSYDVAAANLLKLRRDGTHFSQQDAELYRQTLADAYTRALEAASKGDPKGKAALQMIRAAGPR